MVIVSKAIIPFNFITTTTTIKIFYTGNPRVALLAEDCWCDGSLKLEHSEVVFCIGIEDRASYFKYTNVSNTLQYKN